ncbi:MAG: cob(I)yrinic acid a,c-diamide adenosyltransferase [Candidatus Omnitrophica bacterium]|nr:cob(I)yrinic acid a,c-diamide adenosyltransferase [Candidatus Omnitrophota bacterium]MCM8776717.1 cob(I)yrinic acid a,c-diamide adenosyltransferase [Candidatus Omnitrophota bacterium]
MLEKGLVQVYTGEGKGKTTAAVGLAIRAAGAGLKVGFFQFFKKPTSGEIKIMKDIRNIDIYIPAPYHPAFQYMSEDELKKYKENFRRIWLRDVLNNIKKKHYDVIVLDEILIAIRDGFLDEKNLFHLIEDKDRNSEIVLTGRYITDKIMEKADIITEMKKVKHPFPEIKARKGIEY